MANFLFKIFMNRRLLTLTLLLSGLTLTYFNIASAAPLADRLSGYILLQVQSHGEAWYVIPTEAKRTYLANGETAYAVMSKLGLGITNNNLKKIPVGIDSRIVDIDSDGDGLGDKLEEGLKTKPNNIDSDGDGFDDFDEVTHDYNPLGKEKNIYDQALINRLKGKILLQVEEKGQAWYIHPVNGHRYYMKDGPSAYEIMRFLSLGITNDNLNQIPVSSFSAGVPAIPTVTLDTQAPTAPSNFTATATSTQITLNWSASTDNVAVTQYRLERSTSANTGFSFLTTSSNRNYTNTGLIANTTYYYRVQATDAAGNLSAYSNVLSARTGQLVVDTQAPTAPSNLTATATSTQITLNWSVSTDNIGVAQYRIERSTSATTGFTLLTTTTNHSYINTGLQASTTYYYRVQAIDAAGNLSAYSSIANGRTGLVDTQAPTVPSNFTATSTSTQITLNWSVSTDNIGVAQYRIERSTSATTGFTDLVTVSTNMHINSGLIANTKYYYRVRAVDAAGNLSNYSSIVNATTGANLATDTQNPTNPTNLSGTTSGTQVVLTWTQATDNVGVYQYDVERQISAIIGYQSITSVNATTHTDTNLEPLGSYTYRVKARDLAGHSSGYSNIFTITVNAAADTTAPIAPSNLTATSTSSSQINLTWTAATDAVGVVQHRIDRSTSVNFSTTHTINVVANNFSDTGLSAGTTYYYRVYAVDAAGNSSGFSSVVNATTPADYTISSVLGEDYSLPSSVTASSFSGYVCSNCVNASTTFIWTNWRTMEPQNTSPRTYDWTNLDYQIARAASLGKKVSLMIHSTVAGGVGEISAVPDWVYTEFNLPPYDQLVNMGGTSQIRIIPSWRPEIRARFEEFIAAFGARYNNNNTIESIYITAVSHAAGEELWISNPQLTTLESEWGLTPTVLQTWLESRMAAWLQALPGEERKLVWVGSDHGLSYNQRNDFQAVAKNLIDYAKSHGIGGRAGLVEAYLADVGDYLWDNYKDGNGYIYVNEDSARFDGRYWGDENEEYGPNFTRYGVDHSSPVRYRFAIMRTLQARMRFLWTTQVTEAINPPLSNYARLSFGKNVYTSPDAWSFLFQSPQLNTTPLKNFERWLIQRDIAGGMTVPTERVFRAFDAGGAWQTPSLYYDDTARRTDFASNNNYIYFALDDRFTTSGSVQIKVEMLDNSQTSWHLDYYNSSGVLSSTRSIVNANDNQKKTYTITLNNPTFSNQFNSAMDFRLVNEGPGNITVRWVRLVR